MKAAQIVQFGPPSVITYDDLPRPDPGPGQLLVRVKAAGVGNWDALSRNTRTISNVIQTDTHVTLSVRSGSSTLFARQDYVDEAWRIVDRALTEFTPVFAYEPNTWEPKEVLAYSHATW